MLKQLPKNPKKRSRPQNQSPGQPRFGAASGIKWRKRLIQGNNLKKEDWHASVHRRGSSSFGRAHACIVIYLFGGPSQIDIFDLKPDAPAEFRGEFRPIDSNVPGIR